MPKPYLPLVLLSVAGILGAEPAYDRFGDPLPEGAVARMGSVRLRSEFPVVVAAFAPDGKTLATAGDGHSICFWDPATGKEVRRIAVKSPSQVWCLRYSADGKTLILAGSDTAVYVVDAATGAEQRRLGAPEWGSVLALDVSGDGKTAAALCSPGGIFVWDLHSGKRLGTFPELKRRPDWHGEWLALTPDGKQIVVPHADGSLHLMDVASGKEVLAFTTPPPWPPDTPTEFLRVAISPDGRYLACGSIHHDITLHDLKTGKRVHDRARSFPNAYGLTFSPNSRFLAVSQYTDIRIFGVLSGKEIRRFVTPLTVGSLVFSRDGRTLAGAGPGGHLLGLWDAIADRRLHPPVGHVVPVHALVFFPDGKRLASRAAFGEDLAVWDIAASRDLAHYRGANAFASTLGVAADGKTLQFLADDHVVHRWNPSTGHEERQQALLPPATVPIALSPDGRSVAGTGGYEHQMYLQDLKKDKAAHVLTLPANVWGRELLFSPDGRYLLSDSSDGILRLWEWTTGKQMWEMNRDRPNRGAYLAFTGDGRSLAAAGDKVRIIEACSGGERLALRPISPPSSVACSPDGRFLAYGQLDGGIVVCGTATGKQLAHWQGRQGTICSLAFSCDSLRLASGGENGTVLLWKLPGEEAVPTTLKAEEAAAFWRALADRDAHRAHRALAGLTTAPAETLPLIKERFRGTKPPSSPERLERLIADLDDDAFKVRERATQELFEAGVEAADFLRKALANKPSPESKRRMERLLVRLDKEGFSERLRSLRAIEALERIGTPSAAELLRELAGKSLPEELHEDIEASLRRMDARAPAASRRSPTP